ncbi:MAG: glycosyltransferase family 4 protein [Terriglobales bacterium]
MRVLLTGDAAGGVGAHAAALARGLASRGHSVTLAILGRDTCAGANVAGVEQVTAALPLEWESQRPLPELAAALQAAREWLAQLADTRGIDVLHANHFGLVGAIPRVPTLLGVHSDVVSWWRWVRGRPPDVCDFSIWYGGIVQAGLQQAQAIVAPSRVALHDLRESYGWCGAGQVIPNGIPIAPASVKGDPVFAMSAGRLWDQGKQIALLARDDLAMDLYVAGELRDRPLPPTPRLRWLGSLERGALAQKLAAAHVYIASSCYEPFGLAPLEAAAAGCALLLNNLPSLREVWGPTALYFARNDGEAMSRALRRLADDPHLRAKLAAASYDRACRLYRTENMSQAYAALYRSLQPA